MALKNIIVNENGSNTQLALRPYSRLYCGYSDNLTEGLGVTDQWFTFPYPSTGYETYRNSDWTVDPLISRFTYVGSTPRWFDISATCNITKSTGANATRTILFQWRLNDVPIGAERKSEMNRDSEIISGSGQVYLSPGQYIEPWFKNIDNTDKAILTNCNFNFVEQPDSVFIWT